VSVARAFQERLQALECLQCGASLDLSAPRATCAACGGPLLARYDLEGLAAESRREDLARFGSDLWRYRQVLPFAPHFPLVRLGEGGTPLRPLPRLAAALGMRALWLKEEAGNPAHSFKARGLALAVNGALAFGAPGIALPTAGNAGAAAAAYAAAAGLRCRVLLPEDSPEPFALAARALGAEVRQVPGTIADAARALGEWAPAPEWWNVATFREPFRVEGKKTLGYEIAEQSGWRLPEAIFYPTGGGTGLVGMWRAFRELAALGWSRDRMPRLVAVQPSGCAPIVRAFERGATQAESWAAPRTLASGLKVPSPFADRLILRALAESGGVAVAVSEEELLDGMLELAGREGCLACPEGGATLAALGRLLRSGALRREASVVLCNTGSGLLYPDAWRAALARAGAARAEA
jgi:threonine synthase